MNAFKELEKIKSGLTKYVNELSKYNKDISVKKVIADINKINGVV